MWPRELIEAFDTALPELGLEEGLTKEQVLVAFLDTVARMAVWRCESKPEGLEGAYFWPYTPIGHLTANGSTVGIRTLTLDGSAWGEALGALREFVRANAADICNKYATDPLPYPHQF